MPTFDERCDKLVAFFVSRYDEAFYEVNRLIGIAITLPVTSVEAGEVIQLFEAYLVT